MAGCRQSARRVPLWARAGGPAFERHAWSTLTRHADDLMATGKAKGVKDAYDAAVRTHAPVGLGLPHRAGSTVVLTVGSDCNVGKMSTALELDLLARQRGLSSTFVATGQTG